MKKLLALLALAGFTSVFAQSSVQLFGNIDQSVYRGTYSDKAMLTTASNAGSTSYWGVRGSEKLDGANTASFELRSEIALNTGQTGSSTTGISSTDSRTATVFNRGAWIDFTNANLGGVRVGRQNNAWWDMTNSYNNTGVTSFGWASATAVVSGSTSQHLLYNGTDLNAAGKALNYMGASSGNPSYSGASEPFVGGITYTTPTINGLTGKLQLGAVDTSYTTNKSANNTKGFAVDYKNGNLQAGLGYDAKTDANGDAAWTQRAIGVKYNIGSYTLTAARNQTGFGGLARAQGAHPMTVNAVGVGKTSGRWDYNLGYTKLSDNDDSANSARYVAATARYNFSKQTSWYVGAGQVKNSGASRLGPIYASSAATIPVAGDVGQTVNALLTGIRYQF